MIYLGMDQTGAVDAIGRPKPIPVCLLDGNQFHLALLKTFDLDLILGAFPNRDLSQLIICLDCVLGVPAELGLTWREAVKMTLDQEGFGKGPAQKYFRSLGKGRIYRRRVESVCKANSMFQERPFQKNIQTGTFRFWKEMAQRPDWFYAPWVLNEISSSRIPLIEGYPSLAWKLLFQVRSRQPDQLLLLLNQFYPDLKWSVAQQKQVEKDPNFADAVVLALAAKVFYSKIWDRQPSIEGWILGSDD
jgi:hypothetical protein